MLWQSDEGVSKDPTKASWERPSIGRWQKRGDCCGATDAEEPIEGLMRPSRNGAMSKNAPTDKRQGREKGDRTNPDQLHDEVCDDGAFHSECVSNGCIRCVIKTRVAYGPSSECDAEHPRQQNDCKTPRFLNPAKKKNFRWLRKDFTEGKGGRAHSNYFILAARRLLAEA